MEAAGLLSRVLCQDVERREDGPAIKQGVAQDRLVSVHDPEMRHGRKSASKRFDGHKAAVAVDTDEPADHGGGGAGRERPGCRGGAGAGRADRGRPPAARSRRRWATAPTAVARPARRSPTPAGRCVAKVPAVTNQGCFPKTAFVLDLEAGDLHLPGRADHAGLRARTGGRRAFPLRGGRLRGLPAAGPVRQARRGGGRTVARASAGSAAPGGPAFQASPAFAEVPAPTPDGRAPASPGWSSWASARPATSGAPRRCSNC